VDAADEEVSNFANMRLIIRQIDTLDYADTDIQISDSPGNTRPSSAMVVEDSDTKGSTEAVAPRDVVKGLLGRGKSRVVFKLKLAMESARISLSKEDGTQLGMLVQDEFRFELKVYPGSLNISETLGNLRICDMLLGADHQWGWLCDIRDPVVGSLVELEFQSYNKDEDDYQGHDYSLSGKLSAVRIVFIYRFIQEVHAVGPGTP